MRYSPQDRKFALLVCMLCGKVMQGQSAHYATTAHLLPQVSVDQKHHAFCLSQNRKSACLAVPGIAHLRFRFTRGANVRFYVFPRSHLIAFPGRAQFCTTVETQTVIPPKTTTCTNQQITKTNIENYNIQNIANIVSKTTATN